MADLLPGGVLPPGEPTIDIAASVAPTTFLAATPSTKPIDPNAVEKLAARRADEAPDPFGGLEQVPANDAFSGLEEVGSPAAAQDAFSGLQQADVLDIKDHKSLVDDDTFRPSDYFSQNPQVTKDSAKLQKLLDVYRARQERGLEAGKVLKAAAQEAPGIVVKTLKGARDLGARVIELGIQPAANAVLNKLTGDTNEQQAAIAAEQGKEQLKAAAEIAAGTETAITGLAQLGDQGIRKVKHLFGKSVKDTSDSELLSQLYVDAEFSKTTKKVSEGKGDAVKSVGLDADTLAKNGIVLDKDAIENLSLVDPLTLVATAGAFKVVGVGGKILATAATRAGAQVVIDGVAKLAQSAAAKGISAAGQVVKGAGKIAEPAGAIIGAVKTGTLAGGYAGSKVGKLVGKALVPAGEKIAAVGEQLAPEFIGPQTAGLSRISELAKSPAVLAAKGVAGGAVQGAVTALPLAAASEDSQTAGALLGGGAALGAIHGAVTGTKAAIGETVARKYLDPNNIPFSETPSPAYGTDANLDVTHDAALKSLSPSEQNAVNNFREAVRPGGGEIYVQDQGSYLNRIRENMQRETPGGQLTPGQDAQATLYANTHAFFDGNITDAQGVQRRVVFLNSDAKGLPHDAGHLFQSLLSPEEQTALRKTALENYPPAQLEAFKQAYAKRLGEPDYFTKLGEEAGNNKAADELIAENYGQLFQNKTFGELSAPRKFLDKLGQAAVNAGEALGFDLTAGRTTADLGATPSLRLQSLLRNAAQDVLTRQPKVAPAPAQTPLKMAAPAAPTPAAPVAPVLGGELVPRVTPEATPITPAEVKPAQQVKPGLNNPPETKPAGPVTEAKNIRTTRAEQNDFAAKRAEETGIAEAQKATEADPKVRAVVDQIADTMQKGNPVIEVEHRGIASERGPANPEGRTSRRGTQEQGYQELARLQIENRTDAPADIINAHQKTFVPVRFTTQGGKPTLIAMSLDKVIANVRRVVSESVAKSAQDLLPYPTENGKLTQAAWQQALGDIKTYTENQANGYRGDGQKLVRPTTDIGVSIPSENVNYTPKPLSEAAMNFANLVQGLNPPETARVQKGLTPGNVKGQLLAEVNAKQPLTPTVIKPEHVTKQAFKGFEPRTVKETNPLRNELAARGVPVRELLEVTERLAVEDIDKITPRPDVGFNAPVTDVIRAGFLPEIKPAPTIESELTRRLEEKRKAGLPVTEALRLKTRKEVEFDARNGRLGRPAGGGATFFLPSEVPKELLGDSPSAKDYQAEKEFAGKIISGEAKLEDFPYYPDYETTVAAEAKLIPPGNKVLFVGSGPVPLTPMLLKKAGLDVLGMDYSPEAVRLGTETAKASGNPIDIVAGDATVYPDFRKVDTVFISLEAGNTPETRSKIFENLYNQSGPETQVLVRASKGSDGFPTLPPELSQRFRRIKSIPSFSGLSETVVLQKRDVVTRNFLPDGATVEELGKKVMESSPEEFRNLAQSWDGGLTRKAYDIGLGLTDRADLAKLEALRDTATAKFKSELASGDFDGMQASASKAQLFSEAIGAATGTGSSQSGFKIYGIDPARVPFPEGIKPTVGDRGELSRSFLPASEVKEGLDPIARAAIRTKGGKIFEGAWHGEAMEKLVDAISRGELEEKLPAGTKTLSDFLEGDVPGGFVEDGFTTASGKFLNRAQALDHAQSIGQLRETPAGRGSHISAGVLESKEFEGRRSFLPRESDVVKKTKREKVAGNIPVTARETEAQAKARVELTDYSKYNVPKAKKPKTDKPTGWITPKGEFVPIDEAYHQNWLATNHEQLNKDFGTDFGPDSSVEERLKALNSGFVRIRDTGGVTSVEVNQRFFNGKTKKAIEDRIFDNLDRIDRLRLSLLNNDGQIADASTARLFDSETPRDAVQAAFDAVKPKDEFPVTAKKGGPSNIQRARSFGGDFLPKLELPKPEEISRKKGWLAPDGKFYSLTPGETHTEFADNAISHTGGVYEGSSVLQDAQWARVTPTGGGMVTVENLSAHKLTNAQRRTLKDFAASDPDLSELSFDNGVARPEILHVNQDAAFLPAEEALPGFEEKGGTAVEQRVVRNRVAASREFPEALALEFRKSADGKYELNNGKPMPVVREYAFNETPLAKEAAKGLKGPAREEAYTDALADKLVDLHKDATKNPDIKAGEKWYSTCRTRLKKLLGDDTKIFAELLGATSARTAVDLNFKFALEAYNQWKSGAYTDLLAKYREGKQNFDAATIGDYVAATGNAEPTRAAYLDWWIQKHDLTPLQSNGKKFGMNSRQVLKVLDGSWASEVQGPKTPNFTGNLTGSTFEATIDVWAARMLHRLSNEGNPRKWRIQAGNETGVTDTDFYTGQKTFRKAAEKIGIKPDALQAILWFAEKNHWEKNGWTDTKGAEKSDFNSLLAKTERTPSGKLKTKSAEQELDFGLSESDVTVKK